MSACRKQNENRGAAVLGLAVAMSVVVAGLGAAMGSLVQHRTRQMQAQVGKQTDLVPRALFETSALVASGRYTKDLLGYPDWDFAKGFTPPAHITVGGTKSEPTLTFRYCNPIQFDGAETAELFSNGKEPSITGCAGRTVDVLVAFSLNPVLNSAGGIDYRKAMIFGSASEIAIQRALNGDTTSAAQNAIVTLPPSPDCDLTATAQLFTDANTATLQLTKKGGPMTSALIEATNGQSIVSSFDTWSGTLSDSLVSTTTLNRGRFRGQGTVAGPGPCDQNSVACLGKSATRFCPASNYTDVFNPPSVSLPDALTIRDTPGFPSPLKLQFTATIDASADVHSVKSYWESGGSPAKLNYTDSTVSVSPLAFKSLDSVGANLHVWDLSASGWAANPPDPNTLNPAPGTYSTGAIIPAPGTYTFRVDAASFADSVEPYSQTGDKRRHAIATKTITIDTPTHPAVSLTASKVQVVKGEQVTLTASLSGYVNEVIIKDQDNNILLQENQPDIFVPLTGTRSATVTPTYPGRTNTTFTAIVRDYYSTYPSVRESTSSVLVSPEPPTCTLASSPNPAPAPVYGALASIVLTLATKGYVTNSSIYQGAALLQSFGTSGGTHSVALGQGAVVSYSGWAANYDITPAASNYCLGEARVNPPPPPPSCAIFLNGAASEITVKVNEAFHVRIEPYGGDAINGSNIQPIPNLQAGLQCPGDGSGGCALNFQVAQPGDYTISGHVGDKYRGGVQTCSRVVHVQNPRQTCNQFVHYTGWKCWESWYSINIPKNPLLEAPGSCVGNHGGGSGPYEKRGDWDDDTDSRCGYFAGSPLLANVRCSANDRCYHVAADGSGNCDYNGVRYEVSTLVGGSWTPGAADCPAYSISYSPLVVDFAGTGVELLPPVLGPKFDILGDGHKPHISWPANPEAAMHVVSLKRGAVRDINDLFGDNTVGPDSKKASNGFEALKKWDSNGDGFIDDEDEIWTHLRLWSDKNLNGISEQGELLTMAQGRIKRFDLAYLDVVEMVGFFGNMSRQRSVVELEDGSWLRVFDIYYVQRGETL